MFVVSVNQIHLVGLEATVCTALVKMAGMVRSIGFIGAGNVANALTRGFLAAKLVDKSNLIASAPTEEDVAAIKVRFKSICVYYNGVVHLMLYVCSSLIYV